MIPSWINPTRWESGMDRWTCPPHPEMITIKTFQNQICENWTFYCLPKRSQMNKIREISTWAKSQLLILTMVFLPSCMIMCNRTKNPIKSYNILLIQFCSFNSDFGVNPLYMKLMLAVEPRQAHPSSNVHTLLLVFLHPIFCNFNIYSTPTLFYLFGKDVFMTVNLWLKTEIVLQHEYQGLLQCSTYQTNIQ